MSSSIKRKLIIFSFILSIILSSLIICLLIFLSGERVLLCSSDFPGTQYVANPGLDVMTILLAQPLEC